MIEDLMKLRKDKLIEKVRNVNSSYNNNLKVLARYKENIEELKLQGRVKQRKIEDLEKQIKELSNRIQKISISCDTYLAIKYPIETQDQFGNYISSNTIDNDTKEQDYLLINYIRQIT